MYEAFESYIKNRMTISEDDLQLVKKYFRPMVVKKKQLILKADQICNHLWFIEKGCFRMFNEDEKGHEFTFQFAMEEWWMGTRGNTDYNSPSSFHIESLEDGLLLEINNEDLRYLYEKIPAFREMHLNLQQKNHIKMQERIRVSLSYSAEEKYAHLMANYPAMINRIPLGLIASYLGISRETLSRIRSSFRTP